MNIVDAIKDENLFRPFLADKDGRIDTWRPWMTALRCVYGLPVPPAQHELVRQCTGRDPLTLPKRGSSVACLLTGRRSGKSRTAAIVGAYEAALAGHEAKLSKGERGVVIVCAPSRAQGRIIKDYIRSVFEAPMLRGEVVGETKDGFELANGNRIEILASAYSTIRGYTVLACCIDEVCFLGYDADSKIKNDLELVRAVLPALATTSGRLIAISSPYARKGWAWNTYKKNFGNDHGRTLVWNCPSRTMNATLPQHVVDEALAEDMASAKAEYLGEFRDDVCGYLPRSVLEQYVAKGRTELLHSPHQRYVAFADLSGGRADDAAVAIAHREGDRTILDCLRRWNAPFSPERVVAEMCDLLRQYRVRGVRGDAYAAEFNTQLFRRYGMSYARAEKPKAQLYLEALPQITSGKVVLLDNDPLIDQFANLERRTRSGGRDVIDHPPGQHDDLANVVAGVIVNLAEGKRAGALRSKSRFQRSEAWNV